MAFREHKQGCGVEVRVPEGVAVGVGVALPVGVTVDVVVSVGVRVPVGVPEGVGFGGRDCITNAQSWPSGAVIVRTPPASITPSSITAPLRGSNHSRLKEIDSPEKSMVTEPPSGR